MSLFLIGNQLKFFQPIIRNFLNGNFNTSIVFYSSNCVPFFGFALWNNKKLQNIQTFKVFENEYRRAIKKNLRVLKYNSNHEIAVTCKSFYLNVNKYYSVKIIYAAYKKM